MKKINLELGKVSKGMRLRFSLILDSELGPQHKNFNLVSHFKIDGNEYLRLNPHPFITIDISDTFGKNEIWNANHVVNLNHFSKMKLESRLNVIIRNFQIKDLFYYDNFNHLKVNPEVNNRIKQMPFVIGNKNCQIQYIVIHDEKEQDSEYEGVVFMINSADNYCYLTFDELNYLYYILRSINMTELSLQLMNYYQSLKNDSDRSVEDLTKEYSKPPIIEEIEEIPEPNHIPPIIEPNEIPDLY